MLRASRFAAARKCARFRRRLSCDPAVSAAILLTSSARARPQPRFRSPVPSVALRGAASRACAPRHSSRRPRPSRRTVRRGPVVSYISRPNNVESRTMWRPLVSPDALGGPRGWRGSGPGRDEGATSVVTASGRVRWKRGAARVGVEGLASGGHSGVRLGGATVRDPAATWPARGGTAANEASPLRLHSGSATALVGDVDVMPGGRLEVVGAAQPLVVGEVRYAGSCLHEDLVRCRTVTCPPASPQGRRASSEPGSPAQGLDVYLT
ncbi:hypothetical protein QF030_001399 [Streptomyces rishiriensis]|uniref:Uncharacterized protein n=1 Tax=Streptomyces rishiriensis TaxID=68264 RepID=A0ABU0NJD8_STRRH|nr:hypothetical protein [Streptomyces rishiriensis]